ncbi:MAG: beta-CASP ribonuclease aCPSF1 [Thermoproteota archaeon]|nr:beta-CASP ribonuclease aCPSF1 [Thermoproteota archaeon]
MTTENIEKNNNLVRTVSKVNSEKNGYAGLSNITMDFEEKLEKQILLSIPSEAQITSAKFEGTNIALYTKNPEFSLTELTLHLSALSKSLKKRFIIRTDPSIRLSEDETRTAITKILPREISVSVIFCDEATGEVILEVNNPEGITPDIFLKIAKVTGWITHTRRSPHIPSNSIKNIHSTLKSSSKERQNFYQTLGKRIFRPNLLSNSLLKHAEEYSNKGNTTKDTIIQPNSSSCSPRNYNIEPSSNYQYSNLKEVLVYCLGGVKQVGRSCFVVVTPESKIMLDCGINPGENQSYNAYPRIDWFNFNLDELDAIVISHAHIDHQGFLPTLYKFGYKGPVYCTEPTLPLMSLLQMDSVKISKSNGTYLPYELRDVNEIIKHCIPIPYGKPTDISPDITITLNNAGHIMGSATVHVNISGTHNILYTGDYKYAKTQLLDGAISNYPRVETIITESTYGFSTDIMPEQSTVYNTFTESINHTLKQGGKVLIPVPAVGRAQEIMLVLDKEMRDGRLIESPIFIEGMISEASAIHMSYAHYLGYEVRKSVFQGINPFLSSYFTVINGMGKRDEVFNDDSPSIIMATSGMLEGGPSVEYFKEISPNPKNKIIFVSYQINGTLGRRVLDGTISEASMVDKNGKMKVVPVRCSKQKIDGFSGHSDFNQILSFISKIKPKRVLVNHGEKSKSENVASTIYSRLRIRSSVPDNREILKLR